MKRRLIGLVFVLASLLFSAAVYRHLPARVPLHYDTRGMANSWQSRQRAAYLMPLVAAIGVVIMNVIPSIFPRRDNFKRFELTYWFVANMVIAFICGANVVVLGKALGWPIDVPTFSLLGMGAMFMIVGNVLPRTRSNWFMGIRTPWTMESEVVWRETHRLAGRTFILGGAITLVAAFLPHGAQTIVAFGAMAIACAVPVIYSYFLWRREAA